MEPLLSIVIPTRNRQKYCISVIEDILSYDYSGLELCVQDNSDDNQIEQYIDSQIRDSRLVYKRVSEQIASIFNINDSVKLANGKYVLLLGDDDTILPEIFKTIEWADKEGIDSICQTEFLSYRWPGASPGRSDGVLIIPTYSNKVFTIDINASLNKLFSNGIVEYQGYLLPKVYHGIIRRDRLQQIEQRMGSYFCGLSPDISACIALSSVVTKHVVIDYPITVAGACPSSTTAQNLNNGHRGELSSAPHFYLRGEYHWDIMVPPFYSVETIWADSALHCVDEMHLVGLRKRFNYYRLAAFAIVRNRTIWKFALSKTLHDKNNPKNRYGLLTLLCISWYITYIIVDKVKRIFVKGKENAHLKRSDIEHIRQAVDLFCSMSNENKF